MKNIIAISLSIILSITFFDLSAQHDTIELKKFLPLDTFRLERYALPELKYRSLSMDFNFETFSNTFSWDFIDNESYKDKFSINPEMRLYNTCFINTAKMQISGGDNLYIYYNYRKREEFQSESEISEHVIQTDFNSSRSFKFYNKKNAFLELSPSLFYHYYYYNDFNYRSLLGNVGIFVGKGRIEDVTDAWHTIRIIKDLQRENLLARVPDGTEIKKIASILSKTGHKRIFDYRIKRKENLRDIDKVLTDLGLVSDKSIEYYNSLIDMWYFGIDSRRYANSNFAVGFVPSLNHFKGTEYLNSSNNSIDYNIKVEAKYSIFKPINMTTDFYLNSVLDLGYLSSETSNINGEYSFNYVYFNPSFSAVISKYLSSRTYASVVAKAYYQCRFGDDYSGFVNSFYGGQFQGNLKYYFSPRTDISLNLILYYQSDGFSSIIYDPIFLIQDLLPHYNFTEGFGHGFTIKLTHQLY